MKGFDFFIGKHWVEIQRIVNSIEQNCINSQIKNSVNSISADILKFSEVLEFVNPETHVYRITAGYSLYLIFSERDLNAKELETISYIFTENRKVEIQSTSLKDIDSVAMGSIILSYTLLLNESAVMGLLPLEKLLEGNLVS